MANFTCIPVIAKLPQGARQQGVMLARGCKEIIRTIFSADNRQFFYADAMSTQPFTSR
ncbi:hypothetical protein PUN4_20006 [Paraburkholderia unamae]|nr:hypothetical protein PUN4_20006 [Paraburkholderia unamae]